LAYNVRVRFHSTKTTNELTGLKGKRRRTHCYRRLTLRGALADHIGRMPEVQKSIYYLTHESLASVRDSPFFEVPKKKNFETLLLVDPIDKCAVGDKVVVSTCVLCTVETLHTS
jgi:molecular chaperone HtpG